MLCMHEKLLFSFREINIQIVLSVKTNEFNINIFKFTCNKLLWNTLKKIETINYSKTNLETLHTTQTNIIFKNR